MTDYLLGENNVFNIFEIKNLIKSNFTYFWTSEHALIEVKHKLSLTRHFMRQFKIQIHIHLAT